MNIPKKAVGAATGGAFGGAVAILIAGLFWPDASPVEIGALNIVCSGIAAYAGAWLPRFEGARK